MKISDLCNKSQLMQIRAHIASRESFKHRKDFRKSDIRVELCICGETISRELGDDIWHGHDYLVHFQLNHHIPGNIGGIGYADDTFENYETWEAFEKKMDMYLSRFPFYEKDNEKQLSLFE